MFTFLLVSPYVIHNVESQNLFDLARSFVEAKVVDRNTQDEMIVRHTSQQSLKRRGTINSLSGLFKTVLVVYSVLSYNQLNFNN